MTWDGKIAGKNPFQNRYKCTSYSLRTEPRKMLLIFTDFDTTERENSMIDGQNVNKIQIKYKTRRKIHRQSRTTFTYIYELLFRLFAIVSFVHSFHRSLFRIWRLFLFLIRFVFFRLQIEFKNIGAWVNETIFIFIAKTFKLFVYFCNVHKPNSRRKQ